MNWISLSDFAAILGAMVALFAIIYAVLSLPDFINQKRIENLSTDARRALDVLDELKDTLKDLVYGVNNGGEKDFFPVLNRMPKILSDVQNILQMLPEVSDPLIQKLIEKLKEKTHGPKVREILEVVDLNWDYKEELNLEKFSELEKKLKEIYNIPENRYYNGPGNIFKTLVLTFVVAIIFYLGLNLILYFLS